MTILRKIKKPAHGEYPSYASMYIDLLPDDERVLEHLKNQSLNTTDFVCSLSTQILEHRYKPGKWSIKEIITHIIDDERIYAYRALCFARNDKSELPGFEQDDYVQYSGTGERAISNILDEYQAVRNATITLFNGFTDEALLRQGFANNNKASVRALCYHIAGHEIHHVNFIRNFYL